MEYVFRPAQETEIPAVFDLYVRRVRWMDETGIHQWNETGYLEAYPEDYYREALDEGTLFVLEGDDGALCGAVVLLREDERWDPAPERPAFYVHNLVTDVRAKGAGAAILRAAEALAEQQGLQAMRLDCAVENQKLNAWYEAQGYLPAGTCTDGSYRGRLREKAI